MGWVCGAGVRPCALLPLTPKSNSWFDPRLQVSDVPRTFRWSFIKGWRPGSCRVSDRTPLKRDSYLSSLLSFFENFSRSTHPLTPSDSNPSVVMRGTSRSEAVGCHSAQASTFRASPREPRGQTPCPRRCELSQVHRSDFS